MRVCVYVCVCVCVSACLSYLCHSLSPVDAVSGSEDPAVGENHTSTRVGTREAQRALVRVVGDVGVTPADDVKTGRRQDRPCAQDEKHNKWM